MKFKSVLISTLLQIYLLCRVYINNAKIHHVTKDWWLFGNNYEEVDNFPFFIFLSLRIMPHKSTIQTSLQHWRHSFYYWRYFKIIQVIWNIRWSHRLTIFMVRKCKWFWTSSMIFKESGVVQTLLNTFSLLGFAQIDRKLTL